jgi:thiosulfate/3-mercaptopyruvate sulfurtransferase
MRKNAHALFWFALLMLPVFSYAADLPPLATTDWLQKNLNAKGLVIVDVRSAADYLGGHIPGAVNIPYSSYMLKSNDLSDEMPEEKALVALLGKAGIQRSSRVVAVGKSDNIGPEIGRVTRFLITLAYAGVKTTSMLDGGINKWKKENRLLSTDAYEPAAVTFNPKWNRGLFVDKKTVAGATDKGMVLCDVRPGGFFTGQLVKKPEVARGGHLPKAKEVKAEELFIKDEAPPQPFLVFKPLPEIEQVLGVSVGSDKKKDVITYCNTGVLSSLGWFVLDRRLGYAKVRMYDGSMEEWTKDPAAPVEQ